MESNIIIPVIVINVAAVAVLVAVAVSSRAPAPPVTAQAASTLTSTATTDPASRQRGSAQKPVPKRTLPEGVSETVGQQGVKDAELLTLAVALPMSSFSGTKTEAEVTDLVVAAIGKADVKGMRLIISRGKLGDLGLKLPQVSGDKTQAPWEAEAQVMEVMLGAVVAGEGVPMKYFAVVLNPPGGTRLVRAALAGWLASSNALRDYSQVSRALSLLASVLKVAVPLRLLNLYAGAVPANKYTLALVQHSASDKFEDSVVAVAAQLSKLLEDASVHPARPHPLSDKDKEGYKCDGAAPVFACWVAVAGASPSLLLQYPTFSRIVSDPTAAPGGRPTVQGVTIGSIAEAGASTLIDPRDTVWVDGSINRVANYVSDADARLVTGGQAA